MTRPPLEQRRGAVAVEMAMVCPILVIFFMGITVFGYALTSMNLMNNAARLGVRRSIVDGSTNSEIQALVQQHCADVLGVDLADVTIVIKVNGSDQIAVEQASFSDSCTISISVPFGKVCPIIPDWIAGFALSSDCTMEHE